MHPSERVYTRWPEVEGYCTPLSAPAGSPIELRAASRARTFSVRVSRWALNPEVVWAAEGLRADDHPVCERAWETGCGWPVTVEIPTDGSWPSGFYEVTLHADGIEGPAATSQAFFVLRATRPRHRALLTLATNTYNAYNQWGGRCLYSGGNTMSFERPLERGFIRRPIDETGFDGRITNIETPGDPTHRRMIEYQERFDIPLWTGSSSFWNWERRFIEWAEREGFAFDVAVNADIEDPATLDGYDVMLSVGHDEYWSRPMRNSIDTFVDNGGRWAIFSGNTCFWQVRLEGHQMVAHKGRAHLDDPVRQTDRHHLLATCWCDPAIGHPEATMTGLTFSRGGYHRIGKAVEHGTGAYEVHRPDHWVFEGTGLGSGDLLGAGHFIVGYEVDGCALDPGSHPPRPTGEDGAPTSLEILATAPARLMSITDDRCEPPPLLWNNLRPPGELESMARTLFGDMSTESTAKLEVGHAVMGIFRRGEGEVFNAGTADWCYGLDADPRIRRVTANVLRRFGV
jgi:hypothetical protein